MEWTGIVVSWIGPPLLKLFGADGWKAFEKNPNRQPPLRLRKEISPRHHPAGHAYERRFEPLTVLHQAPDPLAREHAAERAGRAAADD